MPTGYKEPLKRKLAYVEELASDEGIDLSMRKWGAKHDVIMQNISFNVLFSFLIDLYLNLNLHFQMPELDFEMPEFGDFFIDTKTGLTFGQTDRIQKAKYAPPIAIYGISTYNGYIYLTKEKMKELSKYGSSIYDPEQISSKPLKRLLWDLRYKTTDKDGATVKLSGEAIKSWINQLKEYLADKDVADYYYDHMEEVLALIEGMMASVSYWDFAAFDVSVFSEKDKFKSRFTDDWRSEKELETVGVYDVQFDFCRFDFARFCDTYEGGTIEVKTELGDNLQQRIDDFHKRSGFVEQYGEKTMYQRVFFYQKKDKMHEQGGHHQIVLQNLKNHIKQMLNSEGVIAQFRMAYLSFAQELYYLTYEPHRKYKQWKKILTTDELINKYKRMGCDVNLLRKIKEVVEKWR